MALALHPSVRERPQPRMSATALAEYLIPRPDQQDTVLHYSPFSRPPIVNAYGDAIRGLRAYNCDLRRSPAILATLKSALSTKAGRRCVSTVYARRGPPMHRSDRVIRAGRKRSRHATTLHRGCPQVSGK